MKEFKDSKTALVADVDCTAAGKPLCDSNGVQGFPTIKWGDPASLEKYEGGRGFDALKKFAEENFKTEVQKLQEKYQQLQKDKEDALTAVKESGLGLMKAVKASKTSSGEAKTEL